MFKKTHENNINMRVYPFYRVVTFARRVFSQRFILTKTKVIIINEEVVEPDFEVLIANEGLTLIGLGIERKRR